MNPLGRRIPTDFTHVEKHPFQIGITTDFKVERILRLPSWHKTWDQGSEGACVGFGSSMVMSILNESQAYVSHIKPYVHRYNARWLWNEAKKIDEWPDTNPGDDNGTSVRAAMDVLRTLGHVRILHKIDQPADIAQGIKENQWATTVEQMRACINTGKPIAYGVNWYSNFDKPVKKGREFWIGEGDLAMIRGGHCVAIYAASDKRQAFKIKNSWGRSYPEVWLPYTTAQRLLNEQGEATIIVDR